MADLLERDEKAAYALVHPDPEGPPAKPEGAVQGGATPWTTGDFTQEFAFYNMLMAWTPEQCREFYAMLSLRPDFNPRAVQGAPTEAGPIQRMMDQLRPTTTEET